MKTVIHIFLIYLLAINLWPEFETKDVERGSYFIPQDQSQYQVSVSAEEVENAEVRTSQHLYSKNRVNIKTIRLILYAYLIYGGYLAFRKFKANRLE